MDYREYVCKYKKFKRATILSLGAVGVGTGLYLMYKKSMQLEEDKELYREYEETHPEEDYKERMDFYEAEFKRQDEEEERELVRAIDEFNSRRISREECPRCGSTKRKKNRRIRKDNKKAITIDQKDYPKEKYEEYEYEEK